MLQTSGIVLAAALTMATAGCAGTQAQTGYVVMAITIGPNGQVLDKHVEKEEPRGWGFADAALKAVGAWEFKTAQPGRYTMMIKFRMDDGPTGQSDNQMVPIPAK